MYTPKNVGPRTKQLAAQVSPKLNDQLGKGMAAPYTLLDNANWLALGGVDKVKQDIFILLSTPVGRRFLTPDYGSMLPYYVMRVISQGLVNDVLTQTKSALQKFINYITIRDITVQSMEPLNALQIDVDYAISGTQSQETIQVFLALNGGNLSTLPPSAFKITGTPVFKDQAA